MYKKLPMLQEGWDGDYHNTGSNKTPQDEIIRMARENCPYTKELLRGAYYDGFVKAAALVAAHEREACAKVCDAIQKKHEDEGAWLWEAKNCAAAIRARSN